MATASVTYTFAPSTLIESSKANTNFSDIVTFLNGSTIHKDASVAFTAVPSGPATDPSSDNQLTRKRYVDVRTAACVLRANSVSLTSGSMQTLTGLTSQVNTPSSYFTTATDGITFTADGQYRLSVLLEVVGGAVTGNYACQALLDGVRFAADSTGLGSAPFGFFPCLNLWGHIAVTAGQKFSVQHGQDTGATRSVFGWIMAERVL